MQDNVTYSPLDAANISSNALILSLLSAADHGFLTATDLSRAGALFGIEPVTIRMALSRLSRENRLSKISRGTYQLGRNASAITARTSLWRDADHLQRSWRGDWICVIPQKDIGSPQKIMRPQESALRLFGFSKFGDLFLRPNNLIYDSGALNEQLTTLGLSSGAIIFTTRNAIGNDQWRELWPVELLSASYENAIAAMQASQRQLPQLSLPESAAQTYLVGEATIRCINLDPLLPTEFADQARFNEMVSTMRKYSEIGQEIWRQFFASADNP